MDGQRPIAGSIHGRSTPAGAARNNPTSSDVNPLSQAHQNEVFDVVIHILRPAGELFIALLNTMNTIIGPAENEVVATEALPENDVNQAALAILYPQLLHMAGLIDDRDITPEAPQENDINQAEELAGQAALGRLMRNMLAQRTFSTVSISTFIREFREEPGVD